MKIRSLLYCAAASMFAMVPMIFVRAAPPPFEIKQLSLGMTEAQLKEKHGNFYCTFTADNPSEDNICKATGAKSRTAQNYVFELATFADADVGEWSLIISDKVGLKRLQLTMASADFDHVTGALISKYGKPKQSRVEAVTNLRGAKLSNTTMTWTSGKAILTAERFATDLNTMLIVLIDSDYAAVLNKTRQVKAKNDL